MDGPLRIGELARRTGVSADTIRHYERLGLLPTPARTRAGYRQHSPSIVERVQLVRHGLRFSQRGGGDSGAVASTRSQGRATARCAPLTFEPIQGFTIAA